MKFITLATIAVAGSAGKSFPSYDSFHAHCGLEITLEQPCEEVYGALKTTLDNFSSPNFSDPSHGFYAPIQVTDSSLWYTRLGAGKKYTDDMQLYVEKSGSGCKITGKSRSQSLSYYDYYTNYCNMYNPLRKSGLDIHVPYTNNCKYEPSADIRESQCDAY